jgi:hypothetical protein
MFDLASKYTFIFDNIQTYLLLSLVEEYVNGAEIQIRRIDRNRRAILKTLQSQLHFERTKPRTFWNHQKKIFHDAHFYFICIGQISKCLEKLCSRLNNPKLHKISSNFNKEFSREIRNDLEHIASRAIGKKKKGRKEVDIGLVRDFKNFSGDNLTFNGKSYPVNKKELNKIKAIYRKTIEVIHEDYALKDVNFLNRLVTERHIKIITKAIQKEYLKHITSE